jgi:phosphate-selective porin OprO/OprP
MQWWQATGGGQTACRWQGPCRRLILPLFERMAFSVRQNLPIERETHCIPPAANGMQPFRSIDWHSPRRGRLWMVIGMALTIAWFGAARGLGQESQQLPAPVLDPDQAGNLGERISTPEPMPEAEIPAGPVLDPDQIGNLETRVPRRGLSRVFTPPEGTVLDPNQVGNLDKRLEEAQQRLEALEGREAPLPLIRLSGFFQLDDGLFSQGAASRNRIGNAYDGVSFRRTRLQAIGKLTEFTGYSIEMDFAAAGHPSFMDVWGEQAELPFFGTLRIGQFRQPGTMDSWTSIRHLEFLERSAAFQATEPFRRPGIMAYAMSEDERTAWAYSVYATGLTFWNGSETSYATIGDNRNGAQIGNNGGVSFAGRITHLPYYDDLTDGRYLLHVGGGYNYSSVGGSGDSGSFAKTYRSAIFPEFFVGDAVGSGLTGAGTPLVLDTGRILANNFSFFHLELAGNAGPAHFQTEAILEMVNQFGGPTIMQPSAYFQCGYMLTGESIGYLKQAGVFDYNVVPFTPFFGTGRKGRIRGWGAWEIAARYSYVDLSGVNVRPENILPGAATAVPPSPNAGVLNETTVGVNWWWNRFTRVQFNWIHSMPNYVGYGYAPFDIYGTRFQIEF